MRGYWALESGFSACNAGRLRESAPVLPVSRSFCYHVLLRVPKGILCNVRAWRNWQTRQI